MKSIVYALLAALCNSCIGIFSTILMDSGLASLQVAFLRCATAFCITLGLCLGRRETRTALKMSASQLVRRMVLAFFGISVMYLLETTAMAFIPVSLVSFLLYAAGILTIILGCLFLKEGMDVMKALSILIVFGGIGVMFASNAGGGNLRGIVLALLAGSGYSFYIFLTKKWSVLAGLPTLCHLFLFGTLFLGVQLAASGSLVGLRASHLPWIVALAIVPTMGGFYFTNKALSYGPAGEVQLVEMTEPFLATVLGFFVLGQRVSPTDLAGGILIVAGLLILERRVILAAFRS